MPGLIIGRTPRRVLTASRYRKSHGPTSFWSARAGAARLLSRYARSTRSAYSNACSGHRKRQPDRAQRLPLTLADVPGSRDTTPTTDLAEVRRQAREAWLAMRAGAGAGQAAGQERDAGVAARAAEDDLTR